MKSLGSRWLLGILGLAAALPACRGPGANDPAAGWERYEFSQAQMGVPFRIVLYAPNFQAASNAAWAAMTRVSELNHVLSDYETDSELSRLGYRAGEPVAVPVSDDLWPVLARAQSLARQTDGAFDVTIGPYAGLWRKARREKQLPDPERLRQAAHRVGYEKLELNPQEQTARLQVPNMRLDLGGIAKGYALDQAMEVLRAHGLNQALLSAGGDILTGDPPPGRDNWRIEVTSPDLPNAPAPFFVRLARTALATSGDVFQRLEIGGQRYSHIVDPRTGLGLTTPSLVNVIAPDGMTADSLATALSVMGPDRGLALIEQTPGAAAYVVRFDNGQWDIRQSSRLGRLVEKF